MPKRRGASFLSLYIQIMKREAYLRELFSQNGKKKRRVTQVSEKRKRNKKRRVTEQSQKRTKYAKCIPIPREESEPPSLSVRTVRKSLPPDFSMPYGWY